MSITVVGIVASGNAVVGQDSIVATFTSPVVKSSPTEAVHLFVISDATSAAKAVFGATVVQDDAAPEPCYGTLYGSGNPYEKLVGFGIARDLSHVPPIHSNDHEIWAGVVLHDITVGDTITVTYESGSALTWGRVIILCVKGIIASPAPFPSGWWQGFSWAWNRFWPLWGGNTARCFDAEVNNSEFMFKWGKPPPPTNHWSTSCLFTLMDVHMKLGTTTFTSWNWAQGGAVTDDQYLNQGPAGATKLSNVLGHVFLGSPPGDSTNFGGCWDAAPTYFFNDGHDVFSAVFCPGAGPAYDNPGACAPMGSPCLDQVRVRAWEAGDA